MKDVLGPQIGIRRLPHAEGLDLPSYASDGAAGMDIRAAVSAEDPVQLAPMARAAIPTGIMMQIPEGFEVQVRPRSGLALKSGVTCLNTPGTIDWDYRGEVKVLLINLGAETVSITRGMRIAQLIVAPVVRARLEELSELGATKRGTGGFGSTGTA
ncbi:dUTP diphosphatase [Notoacmeibacter ruber]|uniref:Deoxyuridine 5'-triphosphate nucleotidohydrolase n=1 Tax=Notoacmeibacter ruber TaxID=2670375 RepID=A0A3L7J8V7_9HYPH|nr:dUTP diphosphatase [Notoacmeibacter ruber]RLQ86960.1 dUTP diphosphatase [Notoacmeibacter ruber]